MLTKEEHLHFIWKYQIFESSNLQTSFGDKITIFNPGLHNHNQGPDFLQGSIQLENETLFGNIELHLRNEDWYLHKHHFDSHYDNVILHVVLFETEEIYTLTSKQTQIPILCLQNYIQSSTISNIRYLIEQKSDIPCSEIYKKPSAFELSSMKQRLFAERISRKSIWIQELIKSNGGDHETSFYQAILFGFGLKTNSEIFLEIARKTPQKILTRQINDKFKLEAILLGQANLIEPNDEYSQALLDEYQYQKKLHGLESVTLKPLFARMFPASFPTLRLAQFAAFNHGRNNLYSKLINFEAIDQIRDLFQIEVSDYWQNHYRFGTPCSKKGTKLSESFIDKIIINVILPFLFLIEVERDEMPSRSIEIYDQLKPEINKNTNKVTETLNLDNKNAYDSQALIELYKEYCSKSRCLNCEIGFKLLKP
jgi:hypothetical protein